MNVVLKVDWLFESLNFEVKEENGTREGTEEVALFL